MAFKKLYYVCVFWLCFISFTVVKGSCLEYGHSCWGAHGKRSGNNNNNQIFHIDTKPATEVDFADLNAIKESPYDSSEDHLKSSSDTITQNQDLFKDVNANNDPNNEKVLKWKNLLLQQMNKNGKQRLVEVVGDKMAPPPHRTNAVDSYLSDRWRRLPIYNLRRYQPQMANDNWLNDLEREQQQQQTRDRDSEEYTI